MNTLQTLGKKTRTMNTFDFAASTAFSMPLAVTVSKLVVILITAAVENGVSKMIKVLHDIGAIKDCF